MRLLADECCDSGLVDSLRQAGHDVIYVLEDQRGDKDTDILRGAFETDRILLTEDKDFGELVYRLKMLAKGILLIRIPIEDRRLKWPRLQHLIDQFEDRLAGYFVIIDAKRFRFRPLLQSP